MDAWQLDTWEDYRDVNRIGRYRRLSETQRKVVWPVFERVRSGLQERGLLTKAQLFGQLTRKVLQQEHPPFDHVVVDEAQDVSVAQLRFLAALAGGGPNGLFFAGDLGQRIFQQPFSWKELGVEIRGRSQTLKINYRTSHQIRTYADRLLDPEMSDVDGNLEERKGTVSVFNGPLPTIHVLEDEDSECDTVSKWLRARISEGLQPGEVSVFVRSIDQICRAIAAVELSGLPYTVLDYDAEAVDGGVAVSTMHLAKGLEFRAVAVMACDSEVIPLQSRVESILALVEKGASKLLFQSRWRAGLRVSEAFNLDTGDLNLQGLQPSLRVGSGKGGRSPRSAGAQGPVGGAPGLRGPGLEGPSVPELEPVHCRTITSSQPSTEPSG